MHSSQYIILTLDSQAAQEEKRKAADQFRVGRQPPDGIGDIEHLLEAAERLFPKKGGR